MSATPVVVRDERTVAVENAGHRWAHIFLSFALLVDVGFRAFVRGEAAFDLIALLVFGGAVCAVYQARQRTLTRRHCKEAALIALLGVVIGAFAMAIMLWFRS